MSNNPFRSPPSSEVAPPIDGLVISDDTGSSNPPRRSTSTDHPSSPSSSSTPRRSTSTSRPPNSSPSTHRHANSNNTSKNTSGHHSRPSHDLASHEKQVRKDSRARRTIPRDPIDKLDDILGSYHHEGPFDATLASRQIPGRAPIDATKLGNALALAATPDAYIQRALERHEPLDGTCSVPSGGRSHVGGGRVKRYEEEEVGRVGREEGHGGGTVSESVGQSGRRYRSSSSRRDLSRHREEEEGEGRGTRVMYSGKSHSGSATTGTGAGAGEEYELTSSDDRHGIVEYIPSEDEEDEGHGHGDLKSSHRASGSQSSGLLSGLKKRLSVKRH